MVRYFNNDLYRDAKYLVIATQRADTHLFINNLDVGYTAAKKLIDLLEERGVIGCDRQTKPRKILIKPKQ